MANKLFLSIVRRSSKTGMSYGMGGTSGMMGMGMGLGPMAGYYSGSNMAASLLAQSKSNFGTSEFFLFSVFLVFFLVRRTPRKFGFFFL